MSRDFAPRAYQQQIIDHILDNPRCAAWCSMGSGKTVSTLTALDLIDLVEPGPVLVLAPLRVARDTWTDEAAKWKHLRHLVVSPILGSADERRAALRKQADIYTTNYENLPWLVEHLGESWPFTKVVADESTKLKSFRLRQGGKRAQALGKVAHKQVKRFIQLTGTPSPNGLQDLYGQSWFLDQGIRLGRTFQAFTDRWFQAVPGTDGYSQIRPLPFAQEQIQDRMRDICISIDARDYFNIAEPIVNNIRVELPKKVRQLYRDMEREMFMQLEGGHDIEAFNAASRTIKCLQISNGAVYTDDQGTWSEVHDAKLQALESVVEEAAGAPVLVAYHFKSDLARLQKAFPSALNVATAEGLRAAKAGKGRVWLGHPASMGHGIDGLQEHCNIAAFFAHWWAMEERQQFIERIGPTRQAQSGHDRPVFIHNIVAADTIDEMVIARHDSKRSVQDLLIDAMKRGHC